MNIKQKHNTVNKSTERLVIGCTIILITLIINPNLVINEVKAQSGGSSVKTNNKIIMHFHPRLNITADGKPITVAAQIGINSSLWKDHSLDKYGMQAMNMVMPGMAPLHTMDNSGKITVESSVNRSYTLGEFLKIWGVKFDSKKEEVRMAVDGKPIPVTDFENYILGNNAHLDIILNGKPISVPARIGITLSLWKDHSLDKYGMQAMNMVMPGMAPLHTHDDTGIIHVESSVNRTYTLGQFLDIWGGLDLNGKTVKAVVDNKPVSDYRNIVLRDGEQINLQVGK